MGWRYQFAHRGLKWEFKSGFVSKVQLSPQDHICPKGDWDDGFDSTVEAKFAAKWGSAPREGWTLKHEDEVLWKAQKVFVPDFSFTHADGRRVLMEIAGFWTPEYAEAKRATLALFPEANIFVAVPEEHCEDYAEAGFPILPYKSAIKIAQVMPFLDPEEPQSRRCGTMARRCSLPAAWLVPDRGQRSPSLHPLCRAVRSLSQGSLRSIEFTNESPM